MLGEDASDGMLEACIEVLIHKVNNVDFESLVMAMAMNLFTENAKLPNDRSEDDVYDIVHYATVEQGE